MTDISDPMADDPRPTDALSIAASEIVDDPTAGEEFDTGPEALAALERGEARIDPTTESATIPEIRWSIDADQPDYAHLRTSAADALGAGAAAALNWPVWQLLMRANRFKPTGKDGLVAFGLRGAKLSGADSQAGLAEVSFEDIRPNHADFNCTLGIVDTNARTFRAYRGSTVPNKKWMRNYYKIVHNLPTDRPDTKCNLLPTGCYIYRVASHSGGKIKPALRMTNPDDLTQDAACTVLRTSEDLAFSHDDLWDKTTPYDNIHCAYSESSFSSAGCQTIKGADKSGAWGDFQKVIGDLGQGARIDYVLLTGREVAIAAAIIAAGQQDDTALVDACLGRLRVGSEGPDVVAMQKKLGFRGSGYFGPVTKVAVTKSEDAHGRDSDGIYAPADDLATGWQVFGAAQSPAAADPGPAPEPQPDPAPTGPITLSLAGAANGARAGVATSPDTVTLLAEPGTPLNIAADLTLNARGGDVPLRLNAAIEGAVPGIVLELQLTARAAQSTPSAAATAETRPEATSSGALLTTERIDAFLPRALPEYRAIFVEEGADILARYGLTANPRRLSQFLAQISHESGGLRLKSESLNYSATRLTEVWPNRFPTEADAAPFAGNEEALGNEVYGGRLGNSEPGDGFRFRGRGMIQLTGRDNYKRFSSLVGVDLVTDPDRAADPKTALLVAAEFWAGAKRSGERSMNALADDDKLRAITYRINGGFTNLDHRAAELARAKSIFGDINTPVARAITDRGDNDDQVRTLQLLLIEHRVLRGKVDGKFGNGTYKGLFAFKNARRMEGAGYADAATFSALRDAARPAETTEAMTALPSTEDEPEPVRPF
ncbi:MAG: hypothetical protein AAGA70_02885 [Pseudomonadota bacterium]